MSSATGALPVFEFFNKLLRGYPVLRAITPQNALRFLWTHNLPNVHGSFASPPLSFRFAIAKSYLLFTKIYQLCFQLMHFW